MAASGEISHRVGAVCDVAPERLTALDDEVKKFTHIGEALLEINPKIVVVTTNETTHFDVLRAVAAPNRIIICEKPLTSTLDEANQILPDMRSTLLSLNLVERFSPIITAFRQWQKENLVLTCQRVEAFWGKYRIANSRPTMGVLSEIIHPIDLVDYIFGFEGWKVHSVTGTSSDFSVDRSPKHDSIDVLFKTDNFPVLVHSSFVWPERARQIVAIMRDEAHNLYLVTFDFDNPHWDCDQLKIYSIDATSGYRHLIYSNETRNVDFPAELHGIHKVKEFTKASLLAAQGEANDERLVFLDSSIKLQTILASIEDELAKKDQSLQCSLFNERQRGSDCNG